MIMVPFVVSNELLAMQRRETKRISYVVDMKRSDLYAKWSDLDTAFKRARTPDPRDSMISKRRWEFECWQWRWQLNADLLQEIGVTVSRPDRKQERFQ